jgi:hypothetical protein
MPLKPLNDDHDDFKEFIAVFNDGFPLLLPLLLSPPLALPLLLLVAPGELRNRSSYQPSSSEISAGSIGG